ncbi:hypothetical protein OMQ_01599 [Enterococcus saccharolyticus subsp. saccharolyticus ATCC 43076]|uniref:Uncharacterized protein n=1 Tax=Enterococcus saccharolyticus subsp. saccharolyticus ATCC 43076 TaxID=1139996 RepID=S0NY64_9ENTE|nr:hypothetical protein OMQ_01599 [Enterococcus saccharolyticus subsp. saccharolyticus ATCC 43076]EOT81443.1 hypothetical protein I572_01978 [Enterococcus saccharolyticus subsp. saccharolyticus ATCC 43076]OJG86668.1 hypothetical protein RV16_GL000888 [Enterococcus saccharolyticus]
MFFFIFRILLIVLASVAVYSLIVELKRKKSEDRKKDHTDKKEYDDWNEF